MKDINDFNSIPEWDFNRHRGEDDEGENWKTRPKIERAKVLYNQATKLTRIS